MRRRLISRKLGGSPLSPWPSSALIEKAVGEAAGSRESQREAHDHQAGMYFGISGVAVCISSPKNRRRKPESACESIESGCISPKTKALYCRITWNNRSQGVRVREAFPPVVLGRGEQLSPEIGKRT